MYIPKDATNPSEIQFVDHTYDAELYTAAQQAQIFEDYIKQDPYLSKHRGEVAERNGANRPWYNRLDMKFLQDHFSPTLVNTETPSSLVLIFTTC